MCIAPNLYLSDIFVVTHYVRFFSIQSVDIYTQTQIQSTHNNQTNTHKHTVTRAKEYAHKLHHTFDY